MQTDTVHKQLEQFIRAGLTFEEAVSALRNLQLPVAGLSGLKGASTRAPRLLPNRSSAGGDKHARGGGIRPAIAGTYARTCLTGAPVFRPQRASALWVSLRATLIVLSGVVSAAYVASLPWFLRAADAGALGLTWFLAYKTVLAVRARREK
jgi:hypothetical protein